MAGLGKAVTDESGKPQTEAPESGLGIIPLSGFPNHVILA